MQTHEKVEIVKLATGPQRPINEYKRFAILVLGSFGCIVGSFSYAWNLISSEMQNRYKFSQRDMSTIVTVGLVVQYCALPYAFLYDWLGPIPITVLGTIYFPLGTLLMALCFMGKIKGGVAVLSVFNALMCSGCHLYDFSCCVTVLSYFPTNRGFVTALLKTFTGLGSALVACLYAGYFNSDPEKHFFFLFALAILVGGLLIIFLRLPPYHLTQYEQKHLPIAERQRRESTKAQYLRQQAPLWRFIYGFAILVILIIFLPTESALTSYLKLGKQPKLAFAIVTTVLMFFYLFVAAPLPFWDPKHSDAGEKDFDDLDDVANLEVALKIDAVVPGDDGKKGHESSEPQPTPDTPLPAFDEPVRDLEESAMQVSDDVVRKGCNDVAMAEVFDKVKSEKAEEEVELEVDYIAPAYPGSFLHNLKTLELWALWWTAFCIFGTEFVIIFNATNIMGALDGKDPSSSLSTLLTVLNGVGSAVGRLLMSGFEMWTQKRKAEDRIPLTAALFLPTGSIIISIILFLTLPGAALPLPYVVAAIGNGFTASTNILVTRTIFAKDVAKHYNFCFTATMLTALVFNRFLFSEWYTVQAEKQGNANHRCYGKHCVLMPLVVLMGLSVTAFITDFILHMRYRSFCQRTLAERARVCKMAREGSDLGEPMEELVDDGLNSGSTPVEADAGSRFEIKQQMDKN